MASFPKSAVRTTVKDVPLLPVSQVQFMGFQEWQPASESSREFSRQELGLKTLYDPRRNGYPGEPDFDIVAVHGLLESPERTWTWPSQVSDGALDNYSSYQQEGISSYVRDALTPLSDTLEKIGLRPRPSQNGEQQEQEMSTLKAKKHRRKKKHLKVNWLSDPEMLPDLFPNACIMSFNYGWKHRSTTFRIRNDAANRLLNALAEDREDSLRFPPRPIVFVGHSFGGVVIQTALVLAEQEKFIPYIPRKNDLGWQLKRDRRSEVLNATVGVVFLATPFKITKLIRERWEGVGVGLEGSGSQASESQIMMQEDKTNIPNAQSSKILGHFNSDFLNTVREEHYRLACFYENHQISSKGGSFLDEDSSTLPGYPKIPLMANHASMSKFSSENDRGYRIVTDAIKGFLDFAPTRQLWKAVNMGRIRGVQMMLDLGADPNIQDIEGESALHKAVRCKGNSIRIIEILLSRGADIDLENIEQKTSLSIAESQSKDDIARFLRKIGTTRVWDLKKIGNEHPFDRIYMDGPNQSWNIGRRLDQEALDSNCEAACLKSTLSITHFCRRADGSLDRYRSKTSVFTALYDRECSNEIIKNALTKYQMANEMETQSASFTWYHLPANNMAWVEKLFAIIFNNWFKKDAVEALKSLRSLSGEQQRLNTSNFLYMRPDCRTVDLKFAAKHQQKEDQSFEVEQKVALKLFMPYFQYEKSTAQAEMRKLVDQSTKLYDRQAFFKQKPIEEILAFTLSHQNPKPKPRYSPSPLTSENAVMEDEPGPTTEPDLEREEEGHFGEFISNCMNDPPEKYLIDGYINKETPLHVRRSLDQFYYISKLDDMIDYLDMDQVVYKHFDKKMTKNKRSRPNASASESWETETVTNESATAENMPLETGRSEAFKKLLENWEKENSTPGEHPIVIVDQLWLWVVDGETIITSFPQSTEPSPNGILERIEKSLQVSEVNNIGDLASLIIDECAGSLSHCRAPENISILDIYDETISDAMKQQVEFFDTFTETVLISAVREEYHNLRNAGKHFGMEQELRLKYQDKAYSILSADFDQSPLSITNEAELLREIRDAKEELNIIKRILEEQEMVINKGFKSVTTKDEPVKKFNGGSMPGAQPMVEISLVGCRNNHERNTETINSTIQTSLRSVKGMLERADEICEGLKTLLDLKQKEINVQEARATRQIAQGNEKQSNIILIFTIVTIIFMPLSFLSSFFALNIDRFPRSVNGGVEFSLSWVTGLLFGLTGAFVVPFVIGAFFFVAPGARGQARHLLHHWLKLLASPGYWLSARLRKQRVTKVPRRELEVDAWDPVTYEPPDFD